MRNSRWIGLLLAAALPLSACDDGGSGGDTDAAGGAGGIGGEGGAGGEGAAGGEGGAGGEGAAGGEGGQGGAGGEGGQGGQGGAGGGGTCTAGTAYQAGTPMFVERTEEWGLRRLGVQGTMLTVADVDGDGLADLVARRGGVVADIFQPAVPGRSPLRWSWRDINNGTAHEIGADTWTIGGGDTQEVYTIERSEGADEGFVVAANTTNTGADGSFSRFDYRFADGGLTVCRSATDAATAEAAAAAPSALDDCPEAQRFGLTPAGRSHWVLRNTGSGFVDFTKESGLYAPRGTYDTEVGRPAWVAAFADVDNDGDLDAYTGFDTRNPVTVADPDLGAITLRETSELMINDGAGHFTLAPAALPLRLDGEVDVPSGAAFVDFDRDGNVDFWQSQGGLGAPFQDRLWRNNGGGEFTDVTALAGLSTKAWEGRTTIADLNAALGHTTAWSAAACDLNDDGYPELLAASYGRAPNHLWKGGLAGNRVSFENQSVASGYAYDDNLSWDDNQFARCYCQANRGSAGCADVPAADVGCGQDNWSPDTDTEPFRLGGNSGATVCADFDGDGQLDLYTTEIKHWWAGDGADGGEVLLNRTEGAGADVRFERPGREALGMEINHPPFNWDEGHISAGVIDADNNGRMDIYAGATDYAGNRGRLYANLSTVGAPQFVEVPTADFFEHNRSHGIAVADFDRDGDLDVIVGHSRARCDANEDNNCYPTATMRFFENVIGQDGNWFQLDLRGGEGSNALATGARVTVRTADGWTQVQEVSGGYGHFGQQPDRVLHFGLGAHCDAEITVRWPDATGSQQTFTLDSGLRYLLSQGGEPQAEAPPAR